MDKLFYFYLMLFYLSLVENRYSHGFSRIGRRYSRKDKCANSAEITNCVKGRKVIYRNEDLKISSSFKWCEKNEYTFDYELKNLITGAVVEFHKNSGPTLIVKKFNLDPGKYNVVLKINSPSDQILKLDGKCELTVLSTPLFASIKNGFQRSLKAGSKLILDASASMDYSNEDPQDPNNLQFSWVYNCDGCPGFTSGQATGPETFISGDTHPKKSRYLVKLGIKSKWWPTMTYAYQIINVVETAPDINIRCSPSCISDYMENGLMLKSFCNSNCPTQQKWLWSLYIAPDDVLSIISGTKPLQLQFTREGEPSLQLSDKDKLPPGKTFLLTVALLANNDTVASYKFKTKEESDFGCSLNPHKGIVLETYFRANCSGKGFGSFYWVTVYEPKTRKEIMLDFDNSWEYLLFSVPRVSMVSLRFSHYTGSEGEILWDPFVGDDNFKLTDKELKLNEINDLLNHGNESIEKSLDNFEFHRALNKMTLITKSMENLNVSELEKFEPMIDKLVSDLRKIPMKTITNIEQATGIMESLTFVNKTINPKLTKKMSEVCKKLSEYHEKAVEKHYTNDIHDRRILETTVSQLMKCSIGVNRPSLSAIEPKDLPIEVTTVNYTLIEGEINTEVYEDYMDEVLVLENKDQYKAVSSDFFDICINNGKAISKKVIPSRLRSKSTKFVRLDDYLIATIKKEGQELLKTGFKGHGIDMAFSKDLDDKQEVYIMIICITTNNIFWWEKNVQFISGILVVHVLQNDREVQEYTNSFEIKFTINTKPKTKFPSKTYSIRPKPPDGNDSFENKTQLPIYIIALEAGSSFCIEFLDIQKNVTLHVISTDFELPTVNHFSGNGQNINQKKKYFVDDLKNDHEGFRLISISPSSQEEEIKFEMRAYAVSCMKWIPEERSWNRSCKAKFSEEKNSVICFCKTLSTITVTMEEVEVKEWQKYISLDISLEEQYFYVVNIFMASIYLLYFILLCLAMEEDDYTHKTLYFLSDVTRQSLYGYVIVIKTGTRSGAGTTSNVTIRLIGSRTESEPHVLNYPDPLLKFLQKGNEDWFFLATEYHLGRILEIELWYDGIGALPSWYCSRVNIFDIQSHHWYEFRVSSLFNIHPKPKVYTRVKVFEIAKDNSFKRKLFDILDSLRPEFRIFNLSLRLTNESRSYVKRLTLMFAIIISIGFWCLVLSGIPYGAPKDSIMKLCEYQLNMPTIMNGVAGSLITAVFYIPIIHVFTLFLIILINVYSTIIIFYGVWMPTVNAYLWISSVVAGLLFYILVIETIAGIIMRHMKEDLIENESYVRRNITNIMNDVEKQREILYIMFGKYLLRPFLQHLYRPMQKMKIKYRWMVEKMKHEVKELMENLVMFVIYTTLMYMFILAHRDYYSVNSNKQILTLMDGSHTKTFPLEGVKTIRNLEEYIENTLIGATQSRRWYGEYAVRDPGMTVDYSNKMLGVIRIRQHRSMADSCVVPELMRFINRSCNSDYFESQSFMDYGVRWDELGSPPSEGRMRSIWKFTNSSETGTFPYLGKLGYYDGGGYVAYLGRGMRNSYQNFNYLQQYAWFDILTRGIFIEFLLYNANSNIFNAVQFVIEKSVTGYLKIEVQTQTSRMLVASSTKFTALNTLLGIFIVVVVFLSLKTVLRILRTGMWYFRDLWHFVDIILIVLSYTCIVLYYKRSTEVGSLLKSLEGTEPRDFVNYFPLYRVDTAFTITAALLITVATVKLWLLFRFLVIFKVAERTFSTSFTSLCAIVTYHMIALAGFAYFGYMLFVDHSYKFAGLINSVEFLIELNFRSFSHEERSVLDTPHLGFGYTFYILYSFMIVISECIYVAMILIYYSKAKEYLSQCHEMYSVKIHLKNQIKFYYNLVKVRLKYLRLKGGRDTTERFTPVEPKSDEHRYADCFSLGIDKLRAMSLVSLCILNNSNPKRKPLSQKDIRIMTYTLYYLRKIRNKSENDDEVERFYKCDLGGNKVKIVPEFQLTKVEAATSILLGQPKGETMKKLNINRDAIHRGEITQRLQEMNKRLTKMVDALNKLNIEIL